MSKTAYGLMRQMALGIHLPITYTLIEKKSETNKLCLLECTKPTGQIVGASVIAIASLMLGVWFVRRPG